MNFWTRINTRWSAKDLDSWSSISKSLYVLFPVVIYFLAGEVVQIVLLTIVNNYFAASTAESQMWAQNSSYTIWAMIYGLGIVVSLALIFKAAKSEIIFAFSEEEIEGGKKSLFLPLLGCSVISVAFAIGLNYLFSFIGANELSKTFGEVQKAQYGVDFTVGVILFGILSPVVEEVMFRGMLYNRLKRMFSMYLAMGISSLLFGVFHGDIVQGVYGFLMGLLIVFCYERFKSFWIPVAMHIVANVCVFVLNYTVWK